MTELEGSVVVVTGGRTGVGRALAHEAARRGAHVLIGSISDAGSTVQEIVDAGGSAAWRRTDVSVYEDVAALAAAARELFGGTDVLVNNAAGNIEAGALDEIDPATAHRMFDVNVVGVFNGIHAFGPDLRARAARGRRTHVLNVGSEHSLGVPPHVQALSGYTVSKYATLGFTDVARRDLGPSGVGVSMLAPGWVLTERVAALIESSPQARAAVEPFVQSEQDVARAAFDGLAEGRYIIATNPASRAFALEHAKEVMAEVQRLPVPAEQAAGAGDHLHDGTGVAARCPFSGVVTG